MEQMNLFTWQNEDYSIKGKLRLIELFSGIGAQHKSLSILKEYCKELDFEMWKTCDWSIGSIKAYNDIHIRDYTDYSAGKSHEELVDACMGVSANENEPLTRQQLEKRKDLKEIYNSIVATHNLVNIQNVKGKDLEIVDTDKYTYLMTYSFPCQDLSLAGNQAGIKVGTRSGMLFEVERLLDELASLSLSALPQILIMENVDMLMSKTNGNLATFNERQRKLDSLGYTSFVKVLNAKNYGIPQNRKRVFLVSILGKWEYLFPGKMQLKYKLKDFLDDNVDESYYLTKSKLEKISNWKAQQDPLKDIDKPKIICPTLTARGAGEEHSGMVLINEDTTLKTKFCEKLIAENLVKEGDFINHSRPGEREQKFEETGRLRTESVDNLCPTITTRSDCMGVVVKDESIKRYKNYITWKNKKGEFNTECNRASLLNDVSLTIPTSDQTKVCELTEDELGTKPLRIRKLTEYECYALMGFEKKDCKNVIATKSEKHRQAGNSIVSTVLVAIIGKLYGLTNDKIHEIISDYVEKLVKEKI